jgi:hypothetical protein
MAPPTISRRACHVAGGGAPRRTRETRKSRIAIGSMPCGAKTSEIRGPTASSAPSPSVSIALKKRVANSNAATPPGVELYQ